MTRLKVQTALDEEFARILHERDLRTLFQPIVHLPSRAVVGYEALVRGPEGSDLASAGALLAAANRAGRLVEFDWAARASACRAAFAANLNPEYMLFLNIEPIALDSECPRDLWPDIERAFHAFKVVLEVTERSLDRDPGTLLDGIERQRPVVAGIALDDVGADPATLAMLPLVAPSVIKLDLSVVQATPGEEVARVVDTVMGEAERTGAIILAEGVENDDHQQHAIAYGAQFGQGKVLGTPGGLPRSTEGPRHKVEVHSEAPTIVPTPFDALRGEAMGRAGADLLIALTQYIGSRAEALPPALFVRLVPGFDRVDPANLPLLTRLAQEGTFAAMLGPGVPSEPGHGVRGVGLRREPPPADEWAAVAVGPGANVAIVARKAPGGDGGWIYGVTNDRMRAIAAARSVVRLLGPPTPRFQFEA